jgi:hypothetical protein
MDNVRLCERRKRKLGQRLRRLAMFFYGHVCAIEKESARLNESQRTKQATTDWVESERSIT